MTIWKSVGLALCWKQKSNAKRSKPPLLAVIWNWLLVSYLSNYKHRRCQGMNRESAIMVLQHRIINVSRIGWAFHVCLRVWPCIEKGVFLGIFQSPLGAGRIPLALSFPTTAYYHVALMHCSWSQFYCIHPTVLVISLYLLWASSLISMLMVLQNSKMKKAQWVGFSKWRGNVCSQGGQGLGGHLMCAFSSISVVLLLSSPSCGQPPASQGCACGWWCMALSPPLAGTGFGFGFVRSFARLLVFALKFQIEAVFLLHWVCSPPCPQTLANIFFK